MNWYYQQKIEHYLDETMMKEAGFFNNLIIGEIMVLAPLLGYLGWTQTDIFNKLKSNNGDTAALKQQAIEEARTAARKLGIVLNDELTDKVVTKEDFRKYYVQERAAEKLLEEADKLETDIDGSDGRPKFNKIEVLEYMQNTGHKKLMDAYEAKYKSQTDEWRANQILKAKRKRNYDSRGWRK